MKFGLRGLLSLGLIALLLWKLDLEKILILLSTYRSEWALVTLAILTAGVFWSAWKWSLLAQCLDIHIPYLKLVRWYFVGSFFNHFLPTIIGGDATRVILMAQRSGKLPPALCSVLAERLTGVAALITLAAAGALLFPVPEELRFLIPAYGGLFLAALTFLGWLLSRTPDRQQGNEKPNRLLKKLLYYVQLYSEPIAHYRHHPSTLLIAFGLSLVFQLQVIATAWLVGRTLQIPLSWEICFLCVPLATLITLLPISINGIGVRESVYVALLTRYGLSAEQAFLIGFGTFVLVLIASLLGGVPSLLLPDRPDWIKQEENKPEQLQK